MRVIERFKRFQPATKVAWVMLLVWALFWIWFNVGSGIYEMADSGVLALGVHLVMPLVIVIVLWICWRWQVAGGVLLLALAGAMFWRFGWYSWEVTLILEVPVILIGFLLLLGGILARRTPRPAH